MANFLWGPGGSRMTPDDILAQRKVAQALMMQGADYSPVQSPWQGAARMAQGLLGGYESGEADFASKQNATESAARIAKALSPIMGADASVSQTASPVSAPMGATTIPVDTAAIPGADVIRAGLIKRGVPVPVADGFMMNFRDESGLNPGINEAQPLVPGSRGGFGLAQWTGPRRVALEDFAKASGRPVGDTDTQLDYLLSEINGSEAGSAKSFMSAKTPQEAAVAIAQNFLRPSPENLNKRVAQYSGQPPVQVASNDPSFAPAAPVGPNDASPLDTAQFPAGPMGAPSDNAALPANSTPAQGYAVPGQAARPAINPAIIKEMMTSPYASETERKIGSALFNNYLEQQTKANDPERQIDIQLKQGQLSGLPLELRGKQLANTKAERDLQGEGAMPLSADERASIGIPAGQPAYKTRSGEIKFGPVGTKLNVNTGAIPKGYEQYTDPTTGAIRMREIPIDPTKKDSLKGEAQATSSDVITTAAKRAREAISSSTLPATGTAGAVLSNLGETGAAEVSRQMGVLKSNATIENLNAMRAQSPTGGALGNVTEGEGAMLAAKAGTLDQKSPHFLRDLADYEKTLLRIVHGKKEGDVIFEQTRPDTTGAKPPVVDRSAIEAEMKRRKLL